jgi:hypothetical protein
MRFRHVGTGITSHHLYLDKVSFNYGAPAGVGIVGASSVSFIPTGDIAANNVQAAIGEVDAEKQPLDSDLTSISALTTTSFGRDLLTQADAAATRTYIGAGTSSIDGEYSSLTGIPQALATTSTPQFAKLGINQAADTNYALSVNGPFQIHRNPLAAGPISVGDFYVSYPDGAVGRLVMDVFGSGPAMIFRRANGTAAAKTATVSGDSLLFYAARGYGTSAYSSNNGFWTVSAAENWTDTAQGVYHAWAGTNIGSASAIEWMRLQDGKMSLGGVVPTAQLHTTGTVRFAGLPSGILAADATGVLANRTITGTTDQVVVTNGNGVSGNPTLALPQSIATTSTPHFSGLIIDATAGTLPAPIITAMAQFANSDGIAGGLEGLSFGAAGLHLRGRSCGGTRAAITATPSARTLATMGGSGHDGTSWVTANKGAIAIGAAETWTPTANGTYLQFTGTLIGSTSATEWARFSEGSLGIGTSTPSAKLHVVGSVRVCGASFITDLGNSGNYLDVGPGLIRAGALSLATPYSATSNSILFSTTYDGTDARWEHVIGSGNSYSGALSHNGGTGALKVQLSSDSGANGASATMVDQLTLSAAGALRLHSYGAGTLVSDSSGNITASSASAVATNATDGFLYIPTCAGIPTGTPTTVTGLAPMVVDSVNNKLYIYAGGVWRAMN